MHYKKNKNQPVRCGGGASESGDVGDEQGSVEDAARVGEREEKFTL